MPTQATRQNSTPAPSDWLRSYYFLRAAASVGWVALAVTVGKTAPLPAAILLVAYPAWDAAANLIDARRSGGLKANPSQALNVAVSALTSAAVLVAITLRTFPPLAAFGVWATLAGLLQFATGLRRWKAGGQWAMVLSGLQSVTAGVFFFVKSGSETQLSAATVAPYAAFGAFYFLLSAIWLTVKAARRRSALIVG